MLFFLVFWLPANAQTNRRVIREISANEQTWGASRVLIVLDAPVPDYDFYQDKGKFYLLLPRTELTQLPAVTARYIKSTEFIRRGPDLLIIFEPQLDALPKVQQQSTFFLLFFTPRSNQQGRTTQTPFPTNQTAASNTRPRVIGATRPIGLATAANAVEPRSSVFSRVENTPARARTDPDAVVAAEPVKNPRSATLRIPKVTQAPRLEDFLAGRPRESELTVSDFRQLEPADGQSATRTTFAYLSYDERNLYVVFSCKDDPDKIRAHVSRREDIASDDGVSVTLDTFHDRRRAYVFVVNPLGIQLDGIMTEGQGTDYSFDTLWRSEGRLTSDGYVVWISIPFKSLRFSGDELQTWGIALGRAITRNSEQAYWPYITDRVQGFIQQMATVRGLDQISPGRNIEIRPYVAVTRARTINAPLTADGPYRTENEFRAGVDAKIVFRDALTLDLTVNPDFSQVESDEPQVLVNQRFEVFFPEKRPFFIENAGFFRTPETLFFSRRIVDPQVGARLTGKIGKWAVGGLLIDDRAAGIATDTESFGGRSVIGVGRIQREFAEQSSIGFLVTSQDFRNSSNRVFAADSRIKLNPNWTLSGQAARSYTRSLDASRVTGSSYLAQLTRSGRSFSYDLTYTDRSPGFRANVGFIPRVDIRQIEQYASYRWRPDSRHVLSFGPSGYMLVNWNRQGQVQDWYASGGFEVQTSRQSSFNVDRAESYELFEGRGFRTHQTNVTFSSDPADWVGITASYGVGSAVNYFPGPGLLPFTASSRSGSLALTFRPTARASLYESYIYRGLRTSADATAPLSANAGVFNDHILRSKFNYQFSRKLSLRFILDYNAVLPNVFLVALEKEKRFTSDILLTYMVNPGTAFYVGYTDRYENLLLTPQSFVRNGAPRTPTDRQLFVKMSYLFRY